MGRTFVFNPLTSAFDLVDSGGLYWLDPVATFADLPATDADGATRIVRGEDAAYTYDVGTSTWIFAGKIKSSAFGSSGNANGFSVAADNTLTLQPADATHPGGISTTTQTIAGNKTFSGTVAASNLSGTNTGDVTLSAFGSSPNSNAASLSGQALTFQPADATNPGGVSTAAQTFAGAKTFSTAPILSSLTASLPLQLDGSKNVTATAIDVSGTQATGTLAAGRFPALTGDITTSAGSLTTTVAKIAGTTVSGTTGSSNVVFSSAPTLTNPIVGTQSQGDSSTKAASTSYVDVAIANAIAGVNPAMAVQAATTSASDTSGFTYNNGVSGIGAFFTGSVNTAITIDGFTFTALGQRLLVKNDTQSPSGAFNGVYYVTQVQTGILAPILTRALDYDAPSDINNTGAIPVINGTVNTTTQWVLTSSVTTVGTSPLTFAEFSRNPSDYALKSAGDINETSFAAANNQSAAANVTGLAFANATVRSARVLLSVFVNATSSLYEAFELLLIQKGASWEMAQTSVGDASGFVFTVTTAGQVQYVNSNYSGFVAAAIRFRAISSTV